MRPASAGGHTVVAIADPMRCAWAAHALSCAGVACVIVFDRAELFEALAAGPAALVIGDRFDGMAAGQVIATMVTAGCRVPVFAIDRLDAALGRLITARSAAGTSG
jgi:hypothetical protein